MLFSLTAIETFILIVAVFSLLYFLLPQKWNAVSFLFVVFTLTALAYFVETNESDDLSRYFAIIDNLRDYGHDYLTRCFEEDIFNWGTYRICGYYFYFISKLPSNHFLPAITILIAYGLMFLILYKASVRFHVDKWCLYVGAMILLSTYWYYDTVSGIRNGLVFAIVLACAYYQFVEKKHILLCFAGYVLSCFLHAAAIIPVILAIVVMLTANITGNYIKYFMFFGITIGSGLISYLSEITDNDFIQTLASKVDANADASFSVQTNYIVNITFLICAILIMYYLSYYFKEGEKGKDLSLFMKYVDLVIFFMLGSIFNPLIFLRFARWLLPPIVAVVYMVGGQIQRDCILEEPDKNYYMEAVPAERWRVQSKGVFTLLVCGYIAVHFYYLCAGSSLVWMHF